MSTAGAIDPPSRDPAWLSRLFWIGAVLVILWPLLVATEFKPWQMFAPESLKQTRTFVGSFFPPALHGEFLALVARETWRTVAIASAGITLALAVALPLTLLSTRVLSLSALSGRMAPLPFALRQVMAKFPVTLYTASNCDACEMGRSLLTRRGIPFSERTATTDEDREAWQKVVGGQEAPVLRVGGQMMRGFNAASWDETLDIAGYSRTSQLPPNYKAAAAEPLVEHRPARPPAPAPVAAPATTPAPVDSRSNPNAIRF